MSISSSPFLWIKWPEINLSLQYITLFYSLFLLASPPWHTLPFSNDSSMPGFLSFTVSQSLLKWMSFGLVVLSNHHIHCRPLFLLPSILPSIRVFSNELVPHIRWPKYWSFSISPSKEYSELISLRMDWLDLLADSGTLKSLLQHHSSKASVIQFSAFFIVQL